MPKPEQNRPRDDFDSTCWSVVLAAPGSERSAGHRCTRTPLPDLLVPALCLHPALGHSADDAHDLTQGFFLGVVGSGFLEGVSPEKGKFRAYLLACCRHYLAEQRPRRRARKRGGGRTWEPLDQGDSDRRFRAEPWHDLTPERLYERRWALTLLEEALLRLGREHDPGGNNPLFGRLRAVAVRAGACRVVRGDRGRPRADGGGGEGPGATDSAGGTARSSARRSVEPSPSPR